MIEGIILAAGYASRVGKNKMLLMYEGKTLIDHVIETMKKHVDHVFVVTGHYHDAILKACKNIENVTILYNRHYAQGMFSSVRLGVSHTKGDMMIVPGDMPVIFSSTYAVLTRSECDIAVPVYNGIRGHPILIKKQLRKALLAMPKDGNLKQFRDRYDVDWISVDDPGCVVDIDTIKDYQRLPKRKRSELCED